jgi:hydroxyacylglutathione hydrolase
MKIHQNTGGLAATNAYLIADEKAGKAVLIDAPQNTILALIKLARHEGWDIPLLLLTHGHWDHISDHKIYTNHYPHGKVLIHQLDEPKLQRPGSQMYQLPYQIEARSADGYLVDGDVIKVGTLGLNAIFTPGHSPGHIAFYLEQQKLLVAGDLLFAGSIGRTDLPDSDPQAMRESLQRAMALPDETVVRPGHGPATNIGTERRSNPFLA